MSEIGQVFIARCRHHFAEDFLPKIERCLELLSDEQIWWRANPQSNSIGNLLLHLSGNVRQWIVSGIGGVIDARDRDAEFAARAIIPRDELLARLKQTLGQAIARWQTLTAIGCSSECKFRDATLRPWKRFCMWSNTSRCQSHRRHHVLSTVAGNRPCLSDTAGV